MRSHLKQTCYGVTNWERLVVYYWSQKHFPPIDQTDELEEIIMGITILKFHLFNDGTMIYHPPNDNSTHFG